MKAVFIDIIEHDDTGALYIDGKYAVGHYYLNRDGAIQLLKIIVPDVEIETYIIPEDIYHEIDGLGQDLPDNFIELWQLELTD